MVVTVCVTLFVILVAVFLYSIATAASFWAPESQEYQEKVNNSTTSDRA